MLNIFTESLHGRDVVPPRDTGLLLDPSGYLVPDGLADAVNIALALNQPLLITGEPGTGKTQLGYHIAWRLGLGEPLVFSAKSDTFARDLYYGYDTLTRFHDAQVASSAIAD